MNIRYFLIAILGLPFALQAQPYSPGKTIVAKGKVQFLNPEKTDQFNKVWLFKENTADRKPVDSTRISPEGDWQFTIPASVPSFYSVDVAKWDRATFFTDSDVVINTRGYDTAKMKIKNPPYVFIQGSAANHFINLVEHVAYMNYQQMIDIGKETYYAGESKDTAWISYLKNQNRYAKLNQDFFTRIKVLIEAYKESPVVIYALRMLNWQRDQHLILPILKNLNAKYPWFADAASFQNEMEQKVAQARMLSPGKNVPDVRYPDEKGTKVSLKSFRGKTLLIDFWASWCGPCRAAIPKLKKLYAEHRDAGFEILSISIDDSRDAWIKAMRDEAMPWPQLLSPDKNETMKTFLFSGIPTLYIIDKEGKIVDKFSGFTPEAEAKIAGLFLN